MLPKPGNHLPKVAETTDTSMKIEHDDDCVIPDFEEATVVPPTPLLHHSMSHSMTFTEKLLKTRRPTLALNRLDPKVYLD